MGRGQPADRRRLRHRLRRRRGVGDQRPTNTVTATVPAGGSRTRRGEPADGDAYVINYGNNTVSVIGSRTNTVTTTIPVGTARSGWRSTRRRRRLRHQHQKWHRVGDQQPDQRGHHHDPGRHRPVRCRLHPADRRRLRRQHQRQHSVRDLRLRASDEVTSYRYGVSYGRACSSRSHCAVLPLLSDYLLHPA